jgi:hypothetical protein
MTATSFEGLQELAVDKHYRNYNWGTENDAII